MAARMLAWAVGVILSLAYLVALITPLGNLVYFPQIGVGVSPLGWALLVGNVIWPLAAFAAALLLSRRRTTGQRLMLLLAGVAVVGLVQLEQSLLLPQGLYYL